VGGTGRSCLCSGLRLTNPRFFVTAGPAGFEHGRDGADRRDCDAWIDRISTRRKNEGRGGPRRKATGPIRPRDAASTTAGGIGVLPRRLYQLTETLTVGRRLLSVMVGPQVQRPRAGSGPPFTSYVPNKRRVYRRKDVDADLRRDDGEAPPKSRSRRRLVLHGGSTIPVRPRFQLIPWGTVGLRCASREAPCLYQRP
jgi:hypothetical protein